MSLRVRAYTNPIPGSFTFFNELHKDTRGTFFEAFNEKQWSELGLPIEWKQDSLSINKKGALRGLHIQLNNPQGKLIRCLSGTIIDCALDLRPASPWFKKYFLVQLDSNQKAFYIPPGCAHGFVATSSEAVVYYKCTTIYDQASDAGVNPFCRELGVTWQGNQYIYSSKDACLPSLSEFLKEHQSCLSQVPLQPIKLPEF